ncbi:MAG TPA: hypothetical protein VJB38_06360 [Bacteroidota bacterium]|nr:hypothetical protein [Bacteroidota bacterium]
MVRRFEMVLVAVLFLGLHVRAQEVQLHASIDSSTARVGEWIHLRVTVESSSSVTSVSPMLKDSLGAFEVLQVHGSPAEIDGQSRRQTWDIRLTSFEATEGAIPSVVFGYALEGESTPRYASTPPIPISIKPVEFDPQGDIKDVKPPLTPPWAFEDFLPYGILILVLAALGAGYYYYRRWRKQVKEPERFVPQAPPHEQALFALRSLEQKRLWQQGKVKEYYSEVTEIIRKFFEGQFGIIALEMTSDEILQQMKSVPEARPHWKEMNTFFLVADLVKFAKHQATPAEHENEMKWAYAMVRSSVPKAAEPREEATVNAR